MPELTTGVAFVLGLSSTLHCWGMCGGISTALALGMDDRIRSRPLARTLIVAGYNLGRITSYGIAGALAGAIGSAAASGLGGGPGHLVLQILAALILVLMGAHLAGWFPGLRRIEGAGLLLWRTIQPVGRLFVPVDNAAKALVLGAIWGWLPCGLVYSVLLWSAATADPGLGALTMAAFGLGTLPGMVGAGLAADRLRATGPRLRRAAGVLIMALGLAFPALQLFHGNPGDGPHSGGAHDHP